MYILSFGLWRMESMGSYAYARPQIYRVVIVTTYFITTKENFRWAKIKIP